MESEAQAIHVALFELGGVPFEPVFPLLEIPWPQCWIALQIEQGNVGFPPGLPTRPGDFDIVAGRLLPDASPDFTWLVAIEAKRINVTSLDDIKKSTGYGTTQAANLRHFGFDRALLLHILDRARRADGYLSPFPLGDRAGFIPRLHSLVRPLLERDRSYGWFPLLWAHEANEAGDMTGSYGPEPSSVISPPALPRPTGLAQEARERLVAWLASRPVRPLFFGQPLLLSDAIPEV